jgi:hypothetical protein
MMMGMVSFPLHNEDHISAAYFLSDAMAVGAHSDRVYIERRSARLWGQKMNVMVAVACMPSAAMVPSRSCSVLRRDVVFDRYCVYYCWLLGGFGASRQKMTAAARPS